MYAKRSSVQLLLFVMGVCLPPGASSCRAIAATVQQQVVSDFRAGEEAMRSGQYIHAVAEFKAVLHLDPTLPQARVNLGLADYMLGDYQESAIEFEETLREKPGLLPANLFLGIDYLRLGSADRALPPLQRAVRLAPLNLQAEHALFECDVALGDYLGAASRLHTILLLDPEKEDSLLRLGQGYLDIAKRLAPTIAHNPAWAHRLGGDLLVDSGSLGDAARQYQRALRLDPRQGGLHVILGKIYLSQGNTEAAEKEFQLALKRDPDCVRAYLGLAGVALAQGHADWALDYATGAWKICPSCLGERPTFALAAPSRESALSLLNQLEAPPARPAKEFLIALLARQAGDSLRSQQATSAFQADLDQRMKTETRQPSVSPGPEVCREEQYDACIAYLYSRQTLSPSENLTLGKALLALGNDEPAAMAFARVLGQDPESIEAMYWLCRVSIALADRSFRGLTTAFPDSWQVHLLRAETLRLRQEDGEAIQECQRAAALKPTDPELHDALGALYLDQDAPDKALPELEKAIGLDPSRARTLYLLGRLYVAKHDWRRAISDLRRALRLNPSLVEAHSLLGRAYLHAGNAAAAVPQLELAAPSDHYGDIHYLLFQAYRNLGKPRLAQKALTQSQALRKRSVAIDRAKIVSTVPDP
jgi:tetratricopeptide (TPR) repeat protein